eukprot:gnl/MRDRNA2_/MRDRNA2_63142_c0_seq1.p1 gnl/MRDRNA2_/MRDRNA2_63142_c0~~gnl/MRDRNA2_/MRDRNA2_63142_c0_seq1.p1  ORF type:complete len:886 (-),score=142.96 gnl/MRDRNA2_/MRDRNA2_63142_c0_seq1:82-2739(-)
MASGFAFTSSFVVLVTVTSAASIRDAKGVHGSVLKDHHGDSHVHVAKQVESARVDASGNVMLTDSSAERPRRVSNVNVAPQAATGSSSVLRSEPIVAAQVDQKTDYRTQVAQSTDVTLKKLQAEAILDDMKVSVLRSHESSAKTADAPQPVPTEMQETQAAQSVESPASQSMSSNPHQNPILEPQQSPTAILDEPKESSEPEVPMQQSKLEKEEDKAKESTEPEVPLKQSNLEEEVPQESKERVEKEQFVEHHQKSLAQITPHGQAVAAAATPQKTVTLVQKLEKHNITSIQFSNLGPMGIAKEIVQVLGDSAIERIKKKQLTGIEKAAILASVDAGIKRAAADLKPQPSQRMVDLHAKGTHRRIKLLLDTGTYKPKVTHSQKASMRSWITLLIVLPLMAMFVFWLMDLQKEAPISTDYEEQLLAQANNEDNARKDWMHISGLRFVMILWVFWSHTLGSPVVSNNQCNGNPDDCRYLFPSLSDWTYSTALHISGRGVIAVNFFMTLSGFILLATKDNNNGFTSIGDCLRFYKRRIGKIAVPYWIAVGVFFVLWHPSLNLVTPLQLKQPGLYEYYHNMILSALGVQAWGAWKFAPDPKQGVAELLDMPSDADVDALKTAWSAGPLWFVSVLMFAWIMFPFLYKVLEAFCSDYKSSAPMVAVIVSYILSITPQLISLGIWGADLDYAPTFSTIQWNILCTLPQFMFGMCVGNLLRLNSSARESHLDCPGWLLSLAGDLCFFAIPVACLAVPLYTGGLSGYEVFWCSGCGPLVAGVLYFTCHPRCGAGFIKSFLGSPFMCRLGEYSFYIYALHLPINELVDGALFGFPAPLYPGPGSLVGSGMGLWFLYLGVNVLVAAFLYEVVQKRGANFQHLLYPAKLEPATGAKF